MISSWPQHRVLRWRVRGRDLLRRPELVGRVGGGEAIWRTWMGSWLDG